MRVLTIAGGTFRQAIRTKVLYVVLFFAVATILLSRAIGWISIGEDIRIVMDLGLAALSFFGVLMAILVGAQLVQEEVEKRTIYTVLAKPLERHEFVLGKFLGLLATLVVAIGLMGLVYVGYLVAIGGSVSGTLLLAIGFVLLELMVITAIAILFSAVSSPTLAAIFTFLAFLAGRITQTLREVEPTSLPQGAGRYVMDLIYYLLPNLSMFDLGLEVSHDLAVPTTYVIAAVGYALLYTVAILVLTVLAFHRKEL